MTPQISATEWDGLWTPNMEAFFSGCTNPIAVSDFITSMAVGHVVEVDRLPTELVPAVVLLATIGLHSYEQQIVDDYHALIARQEAMFKDETLYNEHYWHPNLNLVSCIVNNGARGDYFLNENPEAGYMFALYERIINAEQEKLFDASIL